MANDRLLKSIVEQGKALERRAGWLQKMIERQTQTAANIQESVEAFRNDLAATNLALDGLRAEYKRMLEAQGGNDAGSKSTQKRTDSDR